MDLQRKIGPLPLWAWIGIAAVVGYVVYEKRKQSAAAAAVPATVPSTLSTELSGLGSAASPAGSGSGFSSLGDWQSAAASGAIGAGYNPSATETALANYASGQPLSTSQEGILNWVLQHYGPAPGGAQPVIAGMLPPPQGTGSEAATTNQPKYISISQPESVTLERAGYSVYGEAPGGAFLPLWTPETGTTAAFQPYASAKNLGLFYDPSQTPKPVKA